MLLIGVSLITISCQKDDDLPIINENKIQSPFKISKIGKTKLRSNVKLNNKLTKLEENLKNNIVNIQNKDVVSSEYGFTINTDHVNYLESIDGNYHSYTFAIQREIETDSLENLVLSLRPDGSYRSVIVTYNTTALEKENIANGIAIDLTDKVSKYQINDDGLIIDVFSKAIECLEIVYGYCSGTLNHPDGLEPDGSNCPAYTEDVIAQIGNCGSPGGDTSGDSGGPDSSSNPGDSSNNNSNSNNTNGGQTNNGGSDNDPSGDSDYTTPTSGECDTCPEFDDECLISDEDFNAPYSANSPFNVDLGLVRKSCDTINPPENEKFMCIYNKLVASPKFKDLFIDTFGESENLNVVFEVTDIPEVTLPNGETNVPNGDCVITSFNPQSGTVTSVDLRIRIDSNYANSATSLELARTLLHESIHAYLQLKYKNVNLGTTLSDLNNTTLETLLAQYFNGTYDVGQEEHELMFDNMIPTMSIIFSEIRNSLISALEQQNAESLSVFEDEIDTTNMISTSWDWQKFYEYYSLDGLTSTTSFNAQITGRKYTNFVSYKSHANQNFNSPCEN